MHRPRRCTAKRRARCNDVQPIAEHVGNHERHKPAGTAGARSPPPLTRLKCCRTVLSCSMLAPAPLSKPRCEFCRPAKFPAPAPAAAPNRRLSADKNKYPWGQATKQSAESDVSHRFPPGSARLRRLLEPDEVHPLRRSSTQSAGTLTQPPTCFSSSNATPNTFSSATAMAPAALPAPTIAIRPTALISTNLVADGQPVAFNAHLLGNKPLGQHRGNARTPNAFGIAAKFLGRGGHVTTAPTNRKFGGMTCRRTTTIIASQERPK